MKLLSQIAKQFRDVHFGGNWTGVNMKETLADVSWQEARTQVDSLNTIAALVYHSNYYVNAVLKVLKGEPLNAHDKFSFEVPLIESQEDWENLLAKTWVEAREFADLLEQLPESRLWDFIAEEKYGNYYRNIHGIIEHTHYHLGQMVLLKKLLRGEVTDDR
jgi:hypothetical protein